ncbi:dihydroxyacetone kinase 1-like [Trypanosoma grayi]|uniref:dihydroxyacetone kinase 1-like n=1 Tax=Trypanosoma grayi TaxID=71804 RepID=UPI0004F444DE|nr:dihydroxyacetone kinase 1-like [Trypanosoma grayi]KEG12353.1 dihydroxyacetone kinase 1-like [Trypanosoma grayi]
MATPKFIDCPDTAVDTAVKGLCVANPNLRVIENTHVVVNTELDPTKVLVMCGGGSGHEPAHVGFVAGGWLSAAVCGGVFASPPSAHVSAAINYLCERQGPNGPGILVVVKNYLGDILNFEFAVKEMKERGARIETILVADDVCFGVHDVSRRRGIAGAELLIKLVCAAAQKGASLSEVKEMASRISTGLRSLGATLSSCSLPGSKPITTVREGHVAVGLGIHGEKCLYEIPFEGAEPLVRHLMKIILAGGEKENSTEDSVEWKGSKVALMVNNMGSATDLEMGTVTLHALQYLHQAGIDVAGVSMGRYMTSLEMHGISLTVLRFSNPDDISYLFSREQAPLMPFTIPNLASPPIPGPPSALQMAQKEKCGLQGDSVVRRVVEKIFQKIESSEDYLNSLDAAVGDGDLGSGMRRASTASLEMLPHLPWEKNLIKTLTLLAKSVADACGGTSGPLYGAFLLGAGASAAEAMSGANNTAVDLIRAALKGGSAEVQRIGRAKRGERTMVDVLEAINSCPQVQAATSVEALLRECVKAAKSGAEAAKHMPAKHGRSRYMEGKEVGHPDPGAELTALCVETAANAFLLIEK